MLLLRTGFVASTGGGSEEDSEEMRHREESRAVRYRASAAHRLLSVATYGA